MKLLNQLQKLIKKKDHNWVATKVMLKDNTAYTSDGKYILAVTDSCIEDLTYGKNIPEHKMLGIDKDGNESFVNEIAMLENIFKVKKEKIQINTLKNFLDKYLGSEVSLSPIIRKILDIVKDTEFEIYPAELSEEIYIFEAYNMRMVLMMDIKHLTKPKPKNPLLEKLKVFMPLGAKIRKGVQINKFDTLTVTDNYSFLEIKKFDEGLYEKIKKIDGLAVLIRPDGSVEPLNKEIILPEFKFLKQRINNVGIDFLPMDIMNFNPDTRRILKFLKDEVFTVSVYDQEIYVFRNDRYTFAISLKATT